MIIEEFLNILRWLFSGTNAPNNGMEVPEAQRLNGEGDPMRNAEIQQQENRGDENDAQLMGNPANFSGSKTIWNNTIQPALCWNWQIIHLAFLIAVCGAGLLYLDFEMTDKCLSLLQFNVTVSPAVQR